MVNLNAILLIDASSSIHVIIIFLLFLLRNKPFVLLSFNAEHTRKSMQRSLNESKLQFRSMLISVRIGPL